MATHPRAVPSSGLSRICVVFVLAANAGAASAAVCAASDVQGRPAPLILPPPKSLTPTSFTMACAADTPGLVYNNGKYADASGPRGAMNASHCCSQCAATDGCAFWSYNVDPALENVTRGVCKW